MDHLPFKQFMEHVESPLPLTEVCSILNTSSYHCVFIKNEQSNYLYANDNFLHLMGLQHLKQLQQMNILELSQRTQDAKLYRDLDASVLKEGNALAVSETVMPAQNKPIIKTMTGSLYPLYSKNNRSNFVLGIVKPNTSLLKLDWNTVFQLTPAELKSLLVKRRYTIYLPSGLIGLSKMEILTLVELLKGQHAGEISKSLSLKQTTIESYLAHIKNKFGVSNKSELLKLVMKNNLLEQVII